MSVRVFIRSICPLRLDGTRHRWRDGTSPCSSTCRSTTTSSSENPWLLSSSYKEATRTVSVALKILLFAKLWRVCLSRTMPITTPRRASRPSRSWVSLPAVHAFSTLSLDCLRPNSVLSMRRSWRGMKIRTRSSPVILSLLNPRRLSW
jgi:hypothetical protein